MISLNLKPCSYCFSDEIAQIAPVAISFKFIKMQLVKTLLITPGNHPEHGQSSQAILAMGHFLTKSRDNLHTKHEPL